MSYQPIENYGIIGNMRTVALVGMNGSIDWYCYPHFDSPSLFGGILDDNKGGRFQIWPDGDQVRKKQFYWPSTNILVTRFLLPDGIAELEDFMPVGLPADSPWNRHLCRRIHCVKGTVRLLLLCRPAFNYGRESHQTLLDTNGASFNAGNLTFTLSTAVPLKQDGQGGVTAEFVLEEGKSQVFILRAHDPGASVPFPPPELEAEEQKLRVQNAVKTAYYRVLAAQELLDTRRGLSQIEQNYAEVQRQLFQTGQADESEVLEAEVDAQRRRLSARMQENTLREEWKSLAAVIGRPTTM